MTCTVHLFFLSLVFKPCRIYHIRLFQFLLEGFLDNDVFSEVVGNGSTVAMGICSVVNVIDLVATDVVSAVIRVDSELENGSVVIGNVSVVIGIGSVVIRVDSVESGIDSVVTGVESVVRNDSVVIRDGWVVTPSKVAKSSCAGSIGLYCIQMRFSEGPLTHL